MTELDARPRVLVFGAGAVGSLLGGLLAQTGNQVTLLGRSNAGRTINQQGLRVDLPRYQVTARPRFIEHIDDLDAPPDVVLLTTRAYAVPDALPLLKEMLRESTILITVQNGLGTEELIAEQLPVTRLVSASLTASANWVEPGHVESTSHSGGIALAPVTRDAGEIAVERLFAGTGLPVSVLKDYRSMKWSKLLLNMMGNAVPAILDWSVAAVYQDPGTFKIERAAALEALEVIQAEGSSLVSLPGFPVPVLPWLYRLPDAMARRILLSRVRGARGDKPPSLLLDIRAKRERTEARWLYGAVVETGERVGVQTPVNRRVLRVMEGVTCDQNLRDAFRNRPDRLVRNVALGVEEGTGRR